MKIRVTTTILFLLFRNIEWRLFRLKMFFFLEFPYRMLNFPLIPINFDQTNGYSWMVMELRTTITFLVVHSFSKVDQLFSERFDTRFNNFVKQINSEIRSFNLNVALITRKLPLSTNYQLSFTVVWPLSSH